MYQFKNSNIRIATNSDALVIVQLLNKAYRGEASKKGWTTEADLIQGDVRTNLTQVVEIIEKADSFFLVFELNEKIEGCVNLQKQNNRLYLGMFAVNPDLQNAGIGKKMLLAAEEFAAHISCTTIYMIVVSVRTALIDWYVRHGYYKTGKTFPFNEDGISGTHTQVLAFVELEKEMIR